MSWTGQTESLCLNVLLKLSKLSDDSSQTLKSKLFKLASPQEKKKQVAQAATWVGYDSYEDNYPIMWDVKLESFVKPLDPNLDWCVAIEITLGAKKCVIFNVGLYMS